MTLEDFFTLTEMKEGLTAPARVEELVSVMQKEKDSVVKNVSDATRQWSTVASTITATENRDCLDLFVQLNGLWFIDRWLKDAQKFDNDTNDGFVEESITALLRALEKLHIDSQRSVSSGIWITVKGLLGHNSSTVQDTARALFDSWKQGVASEETQPDIEKDRESRDPDVVNDSKFSGTSIAPECSAMDASISKASSNEEIQMLEQAKDDMFLSRNSDDLQLERVDDVHTQACDNPVNSQGAMNQATVEGETPVPLHSSARSSPVEENCLTLEELPICPREVRIALEASSSPVLEPGNAEEETDFQKTNEVADEKQMHEMKIGSDELDVIATSSAPDKLYPRVVLLNADALDPLESGIESSLQNINAAKDGEICAKATTPENVKIPITEMKSEIKNCKPVFQTMDYGGECCSTVLQDSSDNERVARKHEDSDASFSQMEDAEAIDKVKGQSGGRVDGLGIASDCLQPSGDIKGCDVVDQRRSDMELEYGLVDALEVARQVAKEVEREVVDYREPFGSSSSEKILEGGIGQPDSPDSINGKEKQFTAGPPDESPTGQNLSAEASPEAEFINSENPDAKPENYIQDMESSQVTEAVQQPDVNTEKGFCDFDLNQEICSEDMDHPVNLSTTTVSVVSASRAAAVPGLPVAPLKFEGTLGWKGSAATSAFRPASPRRIPDGDRTHSVGGSCSTSKQRLDFLDIDLNVAEGGDGEIGDSVAAKQIPISSGFPSGESSVEVSPRRAERLNWDLNRISDDGDALPSDVRMEGRLFYLRNGHHSPSPASSSSSMQPSLRNIDLNDPTCGNDSSDHRSHLVKPLSENVNPFGGARTVDHVVSLMGSRLDADKKDFTPQSLSILPNGRALEPAIDANLTRIGGVLGLGPTIPPYAPHPVFGYNGLTAGPTMSYSSAMYGPGVSMPYMVDSRGAPVVPQIVASASAVPPSYSQPSFIMSINSGLPALNGAGPSRPSFDLNSGFMMEGGTRDSGVLRQLFSHGEGRLMDEHLRNNSHGSLSSGVGEKRKEPDSGWELFPFNSKYQQPPWK